MGIREPAADIPRQHARLSVCLLLVLCCMVLAGAVHGQEARPAEAAASPRVAISLLTIGPGEPYFERFGHNAIVVRDPATGRALAYNYGLFDFEEADFFWNFARGRMRYRIAAGWLDDDLAMYRAEGRSITEQHLDLTDAQADALAAFLAWNARPENAWYRYDYFTANCSTRVRDALDEALGGALRHQSEGRSRGYTYRLDALRLMAPQPALMLLIDLGLGPFADQRIDFWRESFVPMTLQEVVAGMHRDDGSPLVGATEELAPNHVTEPPLLPPDLRVPFLLLGLGIGVGLWWCGRPAAEAPRRIVAAFATVFELACGLGGLLLLFLWLGTEHQAAWRNENLLLLNPLCLLLLPAWLWRRPPLWVVALAWLVLLGAAFALFSKILPWFVQANAHWIFLLLPIHIALALDLVRRRRS